MTHGAGRPLPVPPRDRLPPPQTRLVHGAHTRAVARRRSQEGTHAVLELGAVADAAGAVQLAVRRASLSDFDSSPDAGSAMLHRPRGAVRGRGGVLGCKGTQADKRCSDVAVRTSIDASSGV